MPNLWFCVLFKFPHFMWIYYPPRLNTRGMGLSKNGRLGNILNTPSEMISTPMCCYLSAYFCSSIQPNNTPSILWPQAKDGFLCELVIAMIMHAKYGFEPHVLYLYAQYEYLWMFTPVLISSHTESLKKSSIKVNKHFF